MKINVDKIPPEGMTQEESIPEKDLDLDTGLARFKQPIEIKAFISKITNSVSVEMVVKAIASFACSRCLKEYETPIEKKLSLNYLVEKNQHEIDIDPDIREDLILDYPLKTLCSPECKGLCAKCGKDLNDGACVCQDK